MKRSSYSELRKGPVKHAVPSTKPIPAPTIEVAALPNGGWTVSVRADGIAVFIQYASDMAQVRLALDAAAKERRNVQVTTGKG